MLYVGLSGGIGSGKSTVSAKFAEMGAVIIDADQLARQVVAPGSDGLAEIVERFGTGVLLPDGSLDRPALGAIVFADESARRSLEAITHPRVQALTDARRREAPRDAIVVHDVPLLVEAGLAPDHHLAVIVDATAEVRHGRLVRDRGMHPEAAQARISAQATDEQRYAVADALLDNNGARDDLLNQVETLWRERLSPYNDNLLADRVVWRESRLTTSGADRGSSPQAAARMIARLERQVTAAGLSDRITSIERVGSTSAPGVSVSGPIDLQLHVENLGLVRDQRFEAVLAAAGFGNGRAGHVSDSAPFPAARSERIFDGFDPAVRAHLHVREDPIR